MFASSVFHPGNLQACRPSLSNKVEIILPKTFDHTRADRRAPPHAQKSVKRQGSYVSEFPLLCRDGMMNKFIMPAHRVLLIE